MSLSLAAWSALAVAGVALVVGRLVVRAAPALIEPVRPLVGGHRRAPEPSRPAALLEWEAALLRARDHGRAARTVLGTRMAPIVATAPPAAAAHPTWSRLRPDVAHDGGGGVALADVALLVELLEEP